MNQYNTGYYQDFVAKRANHIEPEILKHYEANKAKAKAKAKKAYKP